MPNPNFLVNLDGTVLVSDDTAAIYANGATWLDAVPSPNGMGILGDTLYVVSTFEPEPPLWAVPLVDGVPGEPTVVTRFDTGSAPDGLAIDADGGVWVALNLDGELVRVDPTTGTITDRVTGLTTPASLTFGGDDPCSLYVTELYGDTVWRVPTAYTGAVVTPWEAPG
jgi:sugar lactone lactonase YvrE